MWRSITGTRALHDQDRVAHPFGEAAKETYHSGENAGAPGKDEASLHRHRRGGHIGDHKPRPEHRAAGEDVVQRVDVRSGIDRPGDTRDNGQTAEVDEGYHPGDKALPDEEEPADDHREGARLTDTPADVANEEIQVRGKVGSDGAEATLPRFLHQPRGASPR
jgi:hypothetical protein